MKSPFITTQGIETLSEEVTDQDGIDLTIALLAIALCFGIDRTEAAIKATYPRDTANQITSMLNTAIVEATEILSLKG
jgi:hypothetical protein